MKGRVLIPLGLALAACVVVACLWITAPMDSEARANGFKGIVDLELTGQAAADSEAAYLSRATQDWIDGKKRTEARFTHLSEEMDRATGEQYLKALTAELGRQGAADWRRDSLNANFMHTLAGNEARIRDLLARAHRVTLTAACVAFIALMGFVALAVNTRRATRGEAVS